jgi:hypothetical protein
LLDNRCDINITCWRKKNFADGEIPAPVHLTAAIGE